MAGQQDLEASAPLLGEDRAEEGQNERCTGGTCSLFGGISNLTVTAVGAGMLSLPKAFSTVHILSGLALFVFVAFLTYFSTSTIVRYASLHKKRSYGELVKAEFGTVGAVILQLAICIHVGGVMIVYLIIIADVLVGSAPEFGGVLPEMVGRYDNPWFISRPFVVAVLLLGIVVPLLIPRSLTAVAKVSKYSVVMVIFIAATICSLAALAVSKGQAAPDVHVLPSLHDMGDGSPLGVATALLTTLSVACLSLSCHFNLIPIQSSLKDPSCGNMLKVIRYTIMICAALYVTVATSGYALFGSATDGDVLKNLNVSFVSGLVNSTLASALIYAVGIAYSLNLVINFVLKVWAVRENTSELLFKHSAQQLKGSTYYQLTFLLVGAAYAMSVVVPSVWVLVSLVGATACVLFSYIFPGLFVLRRDPSTARRAFAAGLLVLGACMAGVSIYNNLRGAGGL